MVYACLAGWAVGEAAVITILYFALRPQKPSVLNLSPGRIHFETGTRPLGSFNSDYEKSHPLAFFHKYKNMTHDLEISQMNNLSLERVGGRQRLTFDFGRERIPLVVEVILSYQCSFQQVRARFSGNSSFELADGASACYTSYDTVVLRPISIALAIKAGALKNCRDDRDQGYSRCDRSQQLSQASARAPKQPLRALFGAWFLASLFK